MGYPQREVLAAYGQARRDGVRVPEGDPTHGEVVRALERRGYLPRDRARVAALVDRVTAQARVRVRARVAVPEQLALPWSGRWVDDPEPAQLTLPLGL